MAMMYESRALRLLYSGTETWVGDSEAKMGSMGIDLGPVDQRKQANPDYYWCYGPAAVLRLRPVY